MKPREEVREILEDYGLFFNECTTILDRITAAGFAVVPVEPTKEQLDTSWLAPEQTRALWQTLIRAAD